MFKVGSLTVILSTSIRDSMLSQKLLSQNQLLWLLKKHSNVEEGESTSVQAKEETSSL